MIYILLNSELINCRPLSVMSLDGILSLDGIPWREKMDLSLLITAFDDISSSSATSG